MQEAHRDVLADFKVVSSIAIFANRGLASTGFLLSLVAAARWAGPGLRYRLSWLARQAIVSGGRRPVGPRARVHAKTRSPDERKTVLATPN